MLLLLRRRSGLRLGAAVLTTDAAANGYAIYGLGVSSPAAIIGHTVITLLACASLALLLRRTPAR